MLIFVAVRQGEFMASDEIKADYQQLEQVASRFTSQAQTIEQMIQQVRSSMDPLENGGWLGRAAESFFNEMNGAVLPACQRLLDALHEASQVTKEISNTMSRAEDEACAPFRSAR
jgi:WXG100 family type VII secretion target